MLQFKGKEDNLHTQIGGYSITTLKDGRILVNAILQAWFADSVEEAKKNLQEHYARNEF